jgi:hypothetical protein
MLVPSKNPDYKIQANGAIYLKCWDSIHVRPDNGPFISYCFSPSDAAAVAEWTAADSLDKSILKQQRIANFTSLKVAEARSGAAGVPGPPPRFPFGKVPSGKGPFGQENVPFRLDLALREISKKSMRKIGQVFGIASSVKKDIFDELIAILRITNAELLNRLQGFMVTEDTQAISNRFQGTGFDFSSVKKTSTKSSKKRSSASTSSEADESTGQAKKKAKKDRQEFQADWEADFPESPPFSPAVNSKNVRSSASTSSEADESTGQAKKKAKKDRQEFQAFWEANFPESPAISPAVNSKNVARKIKFRHQLAGNAGDASPKAPKGILIDLTTPLKQ